MVILSHSPLGKPQPEGVLHQVHLHDVARRAVHGRGLRRIVKERIQTSWRGNGTRYRQEAQPGTKYARRKERKKWMGSVRRRHHRRQAGTSDGRRWDDKGALLRASPWAASTRVGAHGLVGRALSEAKLGWPRPSTSDGAGPGPAGMATSS